MTTIKGTTKKGKEMIKKAQYNEGYSLNEVYGNYSHAKQKAWEDCLKMCIEENGESFHIISHNSFSFSVAWYVPQGLRIETSCNSYLVTI